MAPRRAAIAALALATSCLLLVTAGAAPTKDGFLVPLASNDAWDYYEFNLSGKIAVTSVNPFNSSRGASDVTAPGSTFTSAAQLLNSRGEVVGINQAVRYVVGAVFDMPGVKGARIYTNLLTIHYEFGTPEKGYFDDTLVVNSVNKQRMSAAGLETLDYDGVISGGTGRFLGATGSFTNAPTTSYKGIGTPAKAVGQFRVWVPRNLPSPTGPITGRRRSL